MGVSVLPILAAIVCIITSGTARCSCFAIRRTVRPNGTNVISETSLVITILNKNGSPTKTNSIFFEEWVLDNNCPPK